MIDLAPGSTRQTGNCTQENFERKARVDPLVRRALQGWRTERAQGIYATVDRNERDAAAEAVVAYVMGAQR